MKWLVKSSIIASFFLFLSAGFSPVSAQETADFATSLSVTYRVQENGETLVRYEVRLKNLTSLVFAQQYALQINSADVSGVKVLNSESKPEKIEVAQSNQQTTISVQFDQNKPVVGRNQERYFTVEYTSKDTASLYGNMLEVSIPKLAEPESIAQYTVIIVVPERFGMPSLIEPAQYTIDTDTGSRVLRFTDAGKETGISVLFGEQQAYDFSLQYHVVNESQNAGIVQVALPPDTAYQRMFYQSVSPEPTTIRRDEDGNWIAEFRVAGQAQQDITATGQVTVYAKPTVPVPLVNPVEAAQQSWWKSDTSPYLATQQYWQVQDPQIQHIAKEHNTPQAIYQFVVDTLQYNYKRLQQQNTVQRLGAAAILADPSNALCQEFTDLFIATARAANIPARRATGYTIVDNATLRPSSLVADVLHAWPEYYDLQEKKWVPIDPTWADTTGGVNYFSKLDVRHIVFAYQGQDDERPYPAGQYKVAGSDSKDVAVTLAATEATKSGTLEMTQKQMFVPSIGIPTTAVFEITNRTGQTLYNTEIQVRVADGVRLLTPQTEKIDVLLPYETYPLRLQAVGDKWWQTQNATITIELNGQNYQYTISARKAFEHPAVRWLVMGGSVAIISGGAGCVLVFGYRWYRSLRRKSKKS